ncbi:MAG: hypothetical protein R3Y63_09580 [Eubacteriales bacterium]
MKKKEFYPSYSEIGGDEIFESADRPLVARESGYYADRNCKVHFYHGSIEIIDLENAMKTGKECTKRTFVAEANYTNFGDMQNDLQDKGIETLLDLLEATEISGYSLHESAHKGVHIFSPFVDNKPIKEPQKWTANHLAKAILSGQVFYGEIEGQYSDDYAGDAQRDFGRGKPVHLEEVARSLIEGGKSGLHITHQVNADGMTEISLSNYSFDYKKFLFDVNCTHELKQERQESMAKTLEESNAALLAQNKKVDLSTIQSDVIYQVKFLEQNQNTKAYEEKSRWMYPEELKTMAQFDYEIVDATPIEIDEDTLYQVGTLQNPVSDQDKADSRFIGCIGGKTVVTGFALKELLAEERQFSVLNISHPDNIPDLKLEMEKAQEGKTWCFSDRFEFDAVGNLERLEDEEQRMEQSMDMGGIS